MEEEKCLIRLEALNTLPVCQFLSLPPCWEGEQAWLTGMNLVHYKTNNSTNVGKQPAQCNDF